MVDYAIPFGIPVAKKISVGTLKINIMDSRTKKGLPDMIARIGQTAMVSGKDGCIRTLLKPGVYYITIDRGRMGMEKTTLEGMPVKVTILGGKENNSRDSHSSQV